MYKNTNLIINTIKIHSIKFKLILTPFFYTIKWYFTELLKLYFNSATNVLAGTDEIFKYIQLLF